MVLIECFQIVFNFLMSLIAIIVPFERNMLIIRILVQLVSIALFVSVTIYITYKVPRVEQVEDADAAKTNLKESVVLPF